MNKKGIIGWIIFAVILVLLISGIVYFKFNPDGFAISSGNSSLDIGYNGSISIEENKTVSNNQSFNSSNSSISPSPSNAGNSSYDYVLTFNVRNASA